MKDTIPFIPRLDSPTPLIFCHLGQSDYLEHTLRTARIANPSRVMFLIGDSANKPIADASGWLHVGIESLESPLSRQFRETYKPVQGRLHHGKRGDLDWLFFVHFRFFALREFMEKSGLERVWHFDSDTMIVADLDLLDESIDSGISTTQCSGICLNGRVECEILTQFCQEMLSIYEDTALLGGVDTLLNRAAATFSLNEMACFAMLKDRKSIQTRHLQTGSYHVSLDHLLWTADFLVDRLPDGRKIKAISVSDGIFFSFSHPGNFRRVVALNLSWMPLSLFQAVEAVTQGAPHDRKLLSDLIAPKRFRILATCLGRGKISLRRVVGWLINPFRLFYTRDSNT